MNFITLNFISIFYKILKECEVYFMIKQKYIILGVFGLFLTGCSNNNLVDKVEVSSEIVYETMSSVPDELESSSDEPIQETNIQISNPWIDCDTIIEAEELAGFEFNSIKSAEINQISVMQGEFNIIQAVFFDGDNKVIIRKSNIDGDISGDFREYHSEVLEYKDGIEINYKLYDSLCLGVSWFNISNGSTYSIVCENPVDKSVVESYVNVVFE